MNYGEEYAYWYLRLNGFFPIQNFVIHKSKHIKHTSDIDLLAIRTPFVYEEIGGRRGDWDPALRNLLRSNRTLGAICEVKTGAYDPEKIFAPKNVQDAVARLGFSNKIESVTRRFEARAKVDLGGQYKIFKLLIANKEPENGGFLFLSIDHIREFLRGRIATYPKEKYRDRMFFSSILFQSFIDTTVLERKKERK